MNCPVCDKQVYGEKCGCGWQPMKPFESEFKIIGQHPPLTEEEKILSAKTAKELAPKAYEELVKKGVYEKVD